jgi:RNA-splicing ligase RtcB
MLIPRSQEPRYRTGGGVVIAGCGVTIITTLLTKWWAVKKNKKLDIQQELAGDVNPWRYAT